MPILTRHTGETINIGDDILVTVLSVNGNQVKIGVQAPKDVSVHQEINERGVAEGKTRRSILSIRKVIPKRSPSLGPPSEPCRRVASGTARPGKEIGVRLNLKKKLR